MRGTWYRKDRTGFDRFFLAADIGGTNTNLALVGVGLAPALFHEWEVPSRSVEDFASLAAQTVAAYEAELPGLRIEACCIGANGPIEDRICQIHNLPWQLDGRRVEAATGRATVLINDFTAVSYALPFVDWSNSQQTAVLQQGAAPEGPIRAVIGAGTGMGVGLLVEQSGRHLALPSEGGHMDFAPFDDETEALHRFMADALGTIPSVELVCSGIGMGHLFRFARGQGWFHSQQEFLAEVDRAGEQLPRLISERSASVSGCHRILELFVRIYARFAANVAVTTLPRAGLFLAGGIASKNLTVFQTNELFQRTFRTHGNPVIRRWLEQIPVAIIRPYNLALIGAANAGVNLLGCP